MVEISILHNPRCSKSRASLQLLIQHGIEPKIIEYLKTPPTPEQLSAILQRLNCSPRECIRYQEKTAMELKLDNSAIMDAELIRLMCQHPVIIERPIVFTESYAAIGRPPENILRLLDAIN